MPDLDTDFYFALLELEKMGRIGSASRLLRAVVGDSEPWHLYSKRLKAAEARLRARIDEWGFHTLVIPFPGEAVQVDALGCDRQRELQFLHEWADAGRLGACRT